MQLEQVSHICVNKLDHHWFRQWLVACSAPNRYLNQCWLSVAPSGGSFYDFESKCHNFYPWKSIWEYNLHTQGYAVRALTHWGRVTHICVGKLTIIGADNGLSPVRRQAIIWTNAGILLIRPSGTNFSEISIEIDVFSFKKMNLKMSSAKWRSVVSASMS